MNDHRPRPHKNDTVSGGNGEGVPPVPIPNTEVKTFSADGTWLDTARESRSPPDPNRSCSNERLLFCEKEYFHILSSCDIIIKKGEEKCIMIFELFQNGI